MEKVLKVLQKVKSTEELTPKETMILVQIGDMLNMIEMVMINYYLMKEIIIVVIIM